METGLTICEESLSRSKTASKRMDIISAWILKFLIACAPARDGVAVTHETAPALAKIWLEALEDIPTDALEAVFKATLRASKWFPTPADILSHHSSAELCRVEEEWQNLLEYCREFVNRDLGMAGQPKLPPEIEHAARAAGGLYYLESCTTSELQWAKKRFIEDLERQRKAGEIAGFLPAGPLRKLLDKATARFSLPAGSDAPAPLPAPVQIAGSSAENIRTYTLPPERDAVYAAMVRKQKEKFAPASERLLAEYRKAHGL
jgi:hypothetical protein